MANSRTTALADTVTAYRAALDAVRASVATTITALTNSPREALTDTEFLRHFFNLLREDDATLISHTQRGQLNKAMETAFRSIAGKSFYRFHLTDGYFFARLELNVDQIGGVENLHADTNLAETLNSIVSTLDRASSATFEIVVISERNSSQESFVTDPYDGRTRRSAWNNHSARYTQTANDWYGHKTYKTLVAALTDAFVYPRA